MMKLQRPITTWRLALPMFVLGSCVTPVMAQFMCVEGVAVSPNSGITPNDPVVLEVSLFGERDCIVFRPIEVSLVGNKFVVEIPVEDSEADCVNVGPLTRTIDLGSLPPGAYQYSVEAKGSAVCHLCDCFSFGSFSVAGGACCVDGQCEEITQTECNQRGGTFAGEGERCSGLSCERLLPAVSDWGMVALTLLLCVALAITARRASYRLS